MALERFYALPSEKRDSILLAAAEQFAERGFHETSYNALLKQIGLGKSSAYYYFADKADLFGTVVQRAYDAYFESIQDLAVPTARSEFWPYIEQLHLRGMHFMLEDPLSARLQQAVTRSGNGGLSSSDLESSLQERYLALVELGQSLGAIRTDVPTDLVASLSLTMSVSLDNWFMGHGAGASTRTLKQWAKSWADLFERAFSPSVQKKREPSATGKRRPRTRKRSRA